MTLEDSDVEYYNLRATIEERNPNVYVNDLGIFGFDEDRVLWITFTKEFKCEHILQWLEDICDYYEISMVVFKVDNSDQLLYAERLDGVVKVNAGVDDITMDALRKKVIAEDKLLAVLQKLYTNQHRKKPRKGK